jgi:hypothetical protein
VMPQILTRVLMSHFCNPKPAGPRTFCLVGAD